MNPKSKLTGLTPLQIRKAIYGESKVALAPILSPTKSDKPIKAIREQQNHDTGTLLNVPFSTTEVFTEWHSPSWFRSDQKADVSVIVPIRNASVQNIVRSWDRSNGGMRVEVLFVEDDCPSNSKQLALQECEAEKPFRGRIYQSSFQQGWGACCNAGAERATGDVIVFLHHDTALTDGWLRPLVRMLRKSEVGAVCPLALDQDGRTFLEAGFKWDGEFLAIGKDIYQEKRLSKPFTTENTPAELLGVSEIDRASSYCLAVRRKDFLYYGGFCRNMLYAEWSDSDFSLFLKERGMKIFCQGLSRVIRSPQKIAERQGERDQVVFENRWANSGRMDALVAKVPVKPRKEVKKIVVKRGSAHGDVLLAGAMAPALRKKFPKAQITYSTDCPEVLDRNPHIDKVVEIHSERWFDLYFDLDMVYEYRPLCNLMTAYAEACGVIVSDCKPFLHSESIEVPECYAVIHAGKTMWAGRNWSPLKFDQIATRLKNEGLSVVVVGTWSDHKTSICDLDLRDKTTVPQLAYVVKNAKVFIGIDSFPMHVAQVFSTPGVCFFGSILPETRLFADSMKAVVADGVSCLGCHHRRPTPCTATTTCEVGVQDCVNAVSVDQIWKMIKFIIDR
jgi:ADP-heptose:LPS heptosyltransferase/GT2 family glycosyltransferase